MEMPQTQIADFQSIKNFRDGPVSILWTKSRFCRESGTELLN